MANAINSLNYGNNTYTFTLPYGSCSTTAGTVAKAVTVDNFSLETGARVAVKFTITNTATSPTLNVNSTGAKAIYYNGAAITAGYLKANKLYEFIYNGTQWDLIGDIDTDTNTTYTFNGAVSTIKDSNLTASRALVSNSSGKVAVSAVTSTELGYLDGVTSNVQTQLNGKAASSHTHSASDVGADPSGSAAEALASAKTYADSAAAAVKNDLLNGAGTAYDTLKELGDLIDDNADAIDALETVAAGKADANHTHAAATTSAAGFMSASDKSKLDGIASGANKITVDSAMSSSSTNPVQNKVVNSFVVNRELNADKITSGTVSSDRLPVIPMDKGGIGSALLVDAPYNAIVKKCNTNSDGTNTINYLATANGALYATSENGQPKFGTLPIAQGGTGATTAAAARTNLGAAASSHSHSAATTSAAGFMSASDKSKLDGIASGANAYSLPTASSSTLGGVKTTSTVTSTSGLTACPIISGVPYYKDTNTTYSLSSFGVTATAAELNIMDGVTATAAEINKLDGLTATTAELNYVDGVTSNIQTQLNGKAASSHTHNYAGSSSAGGAATTALACTGNSATATKLATARTINGVSFDGSANITTPATFAITTAGTGAAYTATVGGITALTTGTSFIMIPNVVSTTTAPTLNVNSLGAKTIRRSVSGSLSLTVAGSESDWLPASKPVRVTYNGTYWVVDDPRPSANDLYGTTSIAKGGTGATTAAAALENLGAAPAGYGLGTISYGKTGTYITTAADLDNLIVNGFWCYENASTPLSSLDVNTKYVMGETIAYSGYNVTQVGYCVDTDTKIVRHLVNSVWSDWLFENPPMATGVEYPTTEQTWGGHTVYRMRVSYTLSGALGSSGTFTEFLIPHGIGGTISRFIRVSGMVGSQIALPYMDMSGNMTVIAKVDDESIIIRTKTGWAANSNWVFDLAYTKTS